jgi:hypothetical protein
MCKRDGVSEVLQVKAFGSWRRRSVKRALVQVCVVCERSGQAGKEKEYDYSSLVLHLKSLHTGMGPSEYFAGYLREPGNGSESDSDETSEEDAHAPAALSGSSF